MAARLRRKPFFLIAAGDDIITAFPEFGFWARNSLLRRAIRTTVRAADHVMAISEHAAGQARALGARSVSTVYLEVDSNLFQPGQPTGRNFVCIVSQLNEYYLRRKPIRTLIRALPRVLAKFPDARLTIIGREADGAVALRRLAEDLQVAHAVEFTGRVSSAEKLRRLQSARDRKSTRLNSSH